MKRKKQRIPLLFFFCCYRCLFFVIDKFVPLGEALKVKIAFITTTFQRVCFAVAFASFRLAGRKNNTCNVDKFFLFFKIHSHRPPELFLWLVQLPRLPRCLPQCYRDCTTSAGGNHLFCVLFRMKCYCFARRLR